MAALRWWLPVAVLACMDFRGCLPLGHFWEPIHSASWRLRIRSFGYLTRSALVRSSICCLLLLPFFFPTPYPRRLFFPFTAAIQPWKPSRFFVGFSDHAYRHGFQRVVCCGWRGSCCGRCWMAQYSLNLRVASTTVLVCLGSGRHLRRGG